MSDATCGACWSGCGRTSGSGAFCLRGVRCGELECLLDNSGDVFSILFSLSDVAMARNDGGEFLQGNDEIWYRNEAGCTYREPHFKHRISNRFTLFNHQNSKNRIAPLL